MTRCLLAVASLLLFAPTSAVAQSGPAMRYIPADSSNYRRSGGRTIDRVVIHTIEGSEAGAISWFRNPRSNVSAHYIVSHAGRITRMLDDRDIGWHCAAWNGRSIGIENEGYAHRDTWTETQLRKLAELTAYLCARYRIPIDRTHIVGHIEVPGATHTDPGPYFPWTRFLSMVRNSGGGSTPPPSGGTPPPPPAPQPTTGPQGGEVTAAALNVRNGVWGSVLGSVSRGQRFVLTGAASGSWRQIYWSGRTAWVHGGYLRGVSGSGQEVTASWLNVRSGPSTGYGRLGAMPRGQRYFETGSSGSWKRIQFDRRSGWAHGGYMQRVGVR